METKILEEFTLTLKYQVTVDTETGEMTTKCIKRTIDKSNFELADAPKRTTKKTKKEESSEPQLILEENKYILNSAAIELLGVTTEDKLDIKYEKKDKQMIPVLGTDTAFGTKSGCKLTKSNSVACRGSKNQELAKYGSIFTIKPHDSKAGLFVLIGDQVLGTSNETLNLEELDENLPFDLDLATIIEDNTDIQEIDASFFQL